MNSPRTAPRVSRNPRCAGRPAAMALLLAAAVLFAIPVLAQDPHDNRDNRNGAADNSALPLDAAGLAEVEVLTRALASSKELLRQQAADRAERFLDSLPLDVAGAVADRWRRSDRSSHVSRAGMLFGTGMAAFRRWQAAFQPLGEAGLPSVAGATFMRLTLGYRDDQPVIDYGWQVRDEPGDDNDSDNWRRVVLIGLDFQPRTLNVARRPGPGDLPAIEAADFRLIARSLAIDVLGGNLPESPDPIERTRRLQAEAGRVVQLAWMAWQTGQRILAGDLLEAVERLVTAIPGGEAPATWMHQHAARLIFNRTLEAWAAGTGDVTDAPAIRDRLVQMQTALAPEALRPDIADVLQGFDALIAAAAADPGPEPPAPAADDPDAAAAAVKRAAWHIHGLTAIRGEREVGSRFPDTLHLIDDPGPGGDHARRLWRMHITAVPALLSALHDRRPTRCLVTAGDRRWLVRVGDVCFELLRRISGRLLMPAERPLLAAPCIDHEERLAAAAAAAWYGSLPGTHPRAFLATRAADPHNPDRLQMIDWLLEDDVEAGHNLCRNILGSGTAGELEPALAQRLIAGDWLESRGFLAHFVAKAKQPHTRLLLARAHFEQGGNPIGAAALWQDIDAGRFPADAAAVAERLDLLRAMGQQFPDTLPHTDERIAALLHADTLTDWQRLAVLSYLAEPRPAVPDVFRAALLRQLDDRRVVGAGMPADDVPDVVAGALAPRWRDYAAAGLSRSLGAASAFTWGAPLSDRDASVGRLLVLLANVAPQVLNDAEAATRAAACVLPEVADLPPQTALPLITAVLRADENDPAAQARATAACLQAGVGLWPTLVRQITTSRAGRRERLVALARELASVVRRVRVDVHLAPDHPQPASATELRLTLAAQLESRIGHAARPAMLREVLGQLAAQAGSDELPLQRADLRLVRLPRGGGSLLELDVTVGGPPDAAPPDRLLRAAVAVDGELTARCALQCGSGWPDAGLLEMLLPRIDAALGAAFDGSASRLVEARLTLAPHVPD